MRPHDDRGGVVRVELGDAGDGASDWASVVLNRAGTSPTRLDPASQR